MLLSEQDLYPTAALMNRFFPMCVNQNLFEKADKGRMNLS